MTELAEVCDLRPTQNVLYRMFDTNGDLLYVGITMDVESRFRDHRREKQWWPEVRTITLEHFSDRATLKSAEQAAILREQPMFNVQNRTPLKPPRPGDPQRTVAVPEDQWQQFGRTADALNTDRSKLINLFIAWANRTEGVTLPRRPPRQ